MPSATSPEILSYVDGSFANELRTVDRTKRTIRVYTDSKYVLRAIRRLSAGTLADGKAYDRIRKQFRELARATARRQIACTLVDTQSPQHR